MGARGRQPDPGAGRVHIAVGHRDSRSGSLIGWYRPVADLLNPVLEVFRNTAALALLPVFVLILGHRRDVQDRPGGLRVLLPILLNTIAGVRTVDPLLIKSASRSGFSPVRLFQKVVLPAAVPTIFTGDPDGRRPPRSWC